MQRFVHEKVHVVRYTTGYGLVRIIPGEVAQGMCLVQRLHLEFGYLSKTEIKKVIALNCGSIRAVLENVLRTIPSHEIYNDVVNIVYSRDSDCIVQHGITCVGFYYTSWFFLPFHQEEIALILVNAVYSRRFITCALHLADYKTLILFIPTNRFIVFAEFQPASPQLAIVMYHQKTLVTEEDFETNN